MANQHPKFGLPNWNSRRDNSYGKHQRKLKKIRQHLLHARIHAPDSLRGWFMMAGYYRDKFYHNGLLKFYTYNDSKVRRQCNRKIRRNIADLDSRPNPGWYRRVYNYENEVI